eukprot:61258-Rhodomonas_salina.1
MPSVGEGANRPPEAAAAEFDPLKKTDGEEPAPAAEAADLLVSPTAASHSAAQTLVGVSQVSLPVTGTVFVQHIFECCPQFWDCASPAQRNMAHTYSLDISVNRFLANTKTDGQLLQTA